MLKRHNKDFLERLINHTMRHGKKGAAIGLLTKSFLLFRQNLTRQAGVSRDVDLRRTEERPQFLCTLFHTAVPSQQSPSALGTNMDKGKPLMATILPYASKEIERSGPPTNQRLVTNLTFSVVVSSSFPIRFPNSQETAAPTEATPTFNPPRIDQPCQRRYQPYHIAGNAVTNLWSDQRIGNNEIGDTRSNLMPCSKMSSVAMERRASSVLACVQGVSKDKKDNTQVVTNQRMVRSKSGTSSIKGFVKDAISNVKPSLETRKKKIAGITRHVPAIVSPSRGEGLAIRWVLAAAKEKQRKGGKELAKCLSDELLDAYLKRGEARQKRDSLHKLAESNRSYVRYRWW